MGIRGIIVVGRYENEVKWQNLREVTKYQMELLENAEYGEAMWNWSLKHGDILEGRKLEQFDDENWTDSIIGFRVAETQGAGITEVSTLTLDVLMACSVFRNTFQQGAHIYMVAVSEN